MVEDTTKLVPLAGSDEFYPLHVPCTEVAAPFDEFNHVGVHFFSPVLEIVDETNIEINAPLIEPCIVDLPVPGKIDFDDLCTLVL